MNLFPMIDPRVSEAEDQLPVAREVKWDYVKNKPVFQKGNPVFVEREEAVLVWAWNALHTDRFLYEIYTWSYGCDLSALIGQPFTEELRTAEAGSSDVSIDLDAQKVYLTSTGVDVSEMSEQEIKEANTADKVFLLAKIKILDAIEEITLDILL